MSSYKRYDPNVRSRAKQRQRDLDASALSSGRVTRSDLRVRNGFLSSLEIVESSIVCDDAFD